MFDIEMRKLKDTLVNPVANFIGKTFHPLTITIFGFLIGLGILPAVYYNLPALAITLWVLNRFFDGLDGAVARIAGKTSDAGGYIDLVADFVLYGVIPLSLAARMASIEGWIATAVLLAVFYVNSAVWMMASAIFEKKFKREPDLKTSINMPRGVVEGFETILFYTVMLALPDRYVITALSMAALTLIGIIIQFIQTLRRL